MLELAHLLRRQELLSQLAKTEGNTVLVNRG